MDLAEFKNEWDKLGKSEEGAIKCFLIGVLEYQNSNKDGEKMIAMTLPENNISRDVRYYLGLFNERKNIAQSYLGGTPENDYEYSYDNDIIIQEKGSKRGEKKSKIFVQSGGKSFASPVHLEKDKDGYWKLFNVSSLATGVVKSNKEKS
ncbi:MAG: DUF6935 domain-containing protein [Promethearchaeota archaeon]